jgi:hypothetical protein
VRRKKRTLLFLKKKKQKDFFSVSWSGCAECETFVILLDRKLRHRRLGLAGSGRGADLERARGLPFHAGNGA